MTDELEWQEPDWPAVLATLRTRLTRAVEAAELLGNAYVAVTVAKGRAERKQAHAEQALIGANRHISVDHEDAKEATRLLRYALHLRMNGENAPGGSETWAQFDRMAEHFLRQGGRMPDPGPAAGYSPVQVPENTGKHPRESGETGTDTDMAELHSQALREDWARRRVIAVGAHWDTHMVKFDGTVLRRDGHA